MKSGKRSRRLLVGAVASALLCVGFTASQAAPRARVQANHPAATQRRSNQTFEAAAQRGDTYLHQGNRPAALREFETATTLAPTNAKLWQLVGDLRFSLDKAPEALSAWERAAALQPWNDAIVDRLARGAVRVGDYERAVAAETRVVSLLADTLESAPETMRTDVGTGNAEPIGHAYMNHLGVLSELAVLSGDFTTAEESARKLMKFAPDAVDGKIALAYVHLHAAEYDDAEDLYREVVAVAPGNATALNNLGNILYMRKDFNGASDLFERILEVDDVSEYSQSIALANLGELLQLQSAFKDAKAMYDQAIAIQPKGAWGYMGLAALLDVTGHYDEATDRMIDGWERDQNHLTRLNMHFYKDEWTWQRDALIAEVEGDTPLAQQLWGKILSGDVPMLKKSAAWHLRTLSLSER